MKLLKSACLSLAFGIATTGLMAQENPESPLKLSLQTKNAHIWRGLEVSDHFLIDGDLRLSTQDNAFSVGVFGLTSFSRDYKEFDYYLSFQKSGFSVALWDIFNFSEKNAAFYNTEEAFNYKARETGHFVDLAIGYDFGGSFPLKLGWNTIVYGRDRGAIDNAGTEGNKYSTYVTAHYPIVRGKAVNLDAGIGGAFALRNPDGVKSTFYGPTAGIVNIDLTASRTVNLGNYELPVSFSAIWNPQHEKTFLQVALDIVRF